jgi:hypothetical protein
MPTVGKAITMEIVVFQSKQKLFLNPTGAGDGYNIETRERRGEGGTVLYFESWGPPKHGG